MCGECGIYQRLRRQGRVTVGSKVGAELDCVFSAPAESDGANWSSSSGGGGRRRGGGGAEGAEEGDYSRAGYCGAVEVDEWDHGAYGAKTGESKIFFF